MELKQTARMGGSMAAEFDIPRDDIGLADQLLPPGKTSTTELETPRDIAGCFLVGKTMREVDPARMVPCEEVLPGAYVPYLIVPNIGRDHRWDLDHGRFQANDERLSGVDRRPLRYGYTQWMPRPTHEAKNEAFDAVLIPETPTAIFQAVLLGAARYFPRRAVDLSGSKPVIVDLTDSMCHEIHREGWVRPQPGSGWKIGFYIARYAIAHGLGAVRESDAVARFREAQNEDARRRASFGVLRQAVKIVTDPFEPAYERARRRGAIRRPEPTAARFVSLYFDRHQPDYTSVIAEALTTG